MENFHVWDLKSVHMALFHCVASLIPVPGTACPFWTLFHFPSGGSEMKNRENVRGNARGRWGALHDRWLVGCVPTCSAILRDTYPFRFIGTGYCPGILSRAQTSSSTLICLSFNYEINAQSDRPGRRWHVTWCDVNMHIHMLSHTDWSRLRWNGKCTSLRRAVCPLPAKQNEWNISWKQGNQ